MSIASNELTHFIRSSDPKGISSSFKTLYLAAFQSSAANLMSTLKSFFGVSKKPTVFGIEKTNVEIH